jgi:hypothetical protein
MEKPKRGRASQAQHAAGTTGQSFCGRRLRGCVPRATDKLEARRREIETQLADALPTTQPFLSVGLFSAADLPANIASGGNEGIAVGLARDDDFRAR